MRRISKWHDNRVLGHPIKGCALCALGAKVVLYITGECNSNCYYCPLMKERRHDITYANEREIVNVSQAIEEAKMISALGAGITGGEPSLVLNRVIEYVDAFKEEFGKKFHCHLYTSHALNKEQLQQLNDVGLDEIRFHPPRLKLTNKMKDSIIMAKSFDFDVGFEIPVLPNNENEIIAILDFAEGINIDFVNMNEFEVTEANFQQLKDMGYKTKSDVSAAVVGSEELADKILKKFKKSSLIIHYCSSSYKDKTQLRNRLIRRAKNYSKEFDQVTAEGLVVRGRIITKDADSTLEITQYLSKVFEVDSNLMEIDSESNTIYTHWKIAETLGSEMEKKYFDIIQSIEIIHQYPYKNGLITYLEPIYEVQ